MMPLAWQAARLRATRRGVPPPTEVARLQHAAAALGGLPALVADVLSAYTLDPNPAASLPVGEADRQAGDDVRLVGGLLTGTVRLGSGRVRYAVDTFADLAADAARNADDRFLAANGEAVAAATAAVLAGTRTDTDPMTAPSTASSILALSQAGLAHGRLVARQALGSSDDMVAAPGWATARRIPPECVAFLRAALVVAARTGGAPPSRDDAEELVRLGAALGVPAGAVRTNLERLIRLLAPVAGVSGPPAGEPVSAAVEAVAAVGPRLGLVYGLCDLLALRQAVS